MDQQWQQKTMYGTLKSTESAQMDRSPMMARSPQVARVYRWQEVYRWHKKNPQIAYKISLMARSLQMARGPQIATSPLMAQRIHIAYKSGKNSTDGKMPTNVQST